MIPEMLEGTSVMSTGVVPPSPRWVVDSYDVRTFGLKYHVTWWEAPQFGRVGFIWRPHE